ncbi:hypothetical protein KJ763_01705 [Patescibacteria group bacterium]|nr:hypothetical protein [Patescibacteria group bacterium]
MSNFFEDDEIDFSKARAKDEAGTEFRYNERREKAKAKLEREGKLSLDPNQYYQNCLKIENKMKETK